MILLSLFTELCSWITLKKEDEGFTETLVPIYQSTRRSRKNEIFISTGLAASNFHRITADVKLECMLQARSPSYLKAVFLHLPRGSERNAELLSHDSRFPD